MVVGAGTMIEPLSELFIFLEQELERFAHHVGRSCIDKLSVAVELQLDFFLQTDLKSCGFWFLDGAFSTATCASSFPLSRCVTNCITRCLARLSREKQPARDERGVGRERPHELLGG